jgi:hypothetical protein
MARQAWRPAVFVLGGLVWTIGWTIGCTPGPITPRSSGDKAETTPIGIDAATGLRGASGSGGSGGVGGSGAAAAAADAAASDAFALPETPKLPRPASASDDAAADAPSARAPRPGEIVIDELLVNPTGDDLGREWIEVANLAADRLDLSQLHLATASTDVAAAAGAIGGRSLLLLGQSGDPSKNGGAPVSVAYGTKLILVNGDGQLSICLGACASGVVLDTVRWGTLGDDYTGHALVVDPTTQSFCPAVAPFGADGSFGTPGTPNSPCVKNVDAGSDGGPLADVSVAD